MATSLKNRIRKLEQAQKSVHIVDDRSEEEIRESIGCLLEELQTIIASDDFKPVCEGELTQDDLYNHQRFMQLLNPTNGCDCDPVISRARQLMVSAYNCSS